MPQSLLIDEITDIEGRDWITPQVASASTGVLDRECETDVTERAVSRTWPKFSATHVDGETRLFIDRGEQGNLTSSDNYNEGKKAALNFAQIDKMYTYINTETEGSVKDFIHNHPALLSVLESAPEQIVALFGNSALCAQLIPDPDKTENMLLAVHIGTNLSPKSASDKLDELYLSEWGNVLDDVANYLFFTVRFQ